MDTDVGVVSLDGNKARVTHEGHDATLALGSEEPSQQQQELHQTGQASLEELALGACVKKNPKNKSQRKKVLAAASAAADAFRSNALQDEITAARQACGRLALTGRARGRAVPQLQALSAQMAAHVDTMCKAEAARESAELAAASARASDSNVEASNVTAARAWEARSESALRATLAQLQGVLADADSGRGATVVPASAGGAFGDLSTAQDNIDMASVDGDAPAAAAASHDGVSSRPVVSDQARRARAFGYGQSDGRRQK